jgi:hypothetical protein
VTATPACGSRQLCCTERFAKPRRKESLHSCQPKGLRPPALLSCNVTQSTTLSANAAKPQASSRHALSEPPRHKPPHVPASHRRRHQPGQRATAGPAADPFASRKPSDAAGCLPACCVAPHEAKLAPAPGRRLTTGRAPFCPCRRLRGPGGPPSGCAHSRAAARTCPGGPGKTRSGTRQARP